MCFPVKNILQAMNEFGLPSLSEVYSVLESADGSTPPYQLLEPGTSTSILQQMALERSLAMKSAGLSSDFTFFTFNSQKQTKPVIDFFPQLIDLMR